MEKEVARTAAASAAARRPLCWADVAVPAPGPSSTRYSTEPHGPVDLPTQTPPPRIILINTNTGVLQDLRNILGWIYCENCVCYFSIKIEI